MNLTSCTSIFHFYTSWKRQETRGYKKYIIFKIDLSTKEYCLDFLALNVSLRIPYRISHPEVFLGKVIMKICSKFTGYPCRNVISVKMFRNFIKITLWHWCSPVTLLHIFRTPFPKNTSEWLLLFLQSLGQCESRGPILFCCFYC